MKAIVLTGVVIIHILVIALFIGSNKGCKISHPKDEKPSNGEVTPNDNSTKPGDENLEPSKLHKDAISFKDAICEPDDKLTKILQTYNHKAIVVLNVNTNEVIFSKNAQQIMPIASLTKMMTALLLAEDVRAGKVNLQAKMRVTKAANKIGGRELWLDCRESFTIDNLLKGMMIHSANDCAYLIAEYLSDNDMPLFIERMNKRAKELNLSTIKFYNCHGLPLKINGNRVENYGCAMDIAKLASKVMNFSEIIKWSAKRCETFSRGFPPSAGSNHPASMLVATNGLVGKFPGVTGMKTGYTDGAKFCSAVTYDKDGQKFVSVVLGVSSSKKRKALQVAILNWAIKSED